MLCEVIWMRCGEWWASSLDLWGSWHPYPLLPTTHLVDFLSVQVNVVVTVTVEIDYLDSMALI